MATKKTSKGGSSVNKGTTKGNSNSNDFKKTKMKTAKGTGKKK